MGNDARVSFRKKRTVGSGPSGVQLRVVFIGIAMICVMTLSACGRVDETPYVQGTEDSVSKELQPDDSILQKLRTHMSMEEEEVPSQQESEEAPIIFSAEAIL